MYIVRIFHPGQAAYSQLQEAVARHFYLHHGARPEPRPDQFWCLTGRDGQAPGYASVGVSSGDNAKLFSEYYLDISLTETYGIHRSELVEIGQFSSFAAKGAGRFLLTYVLRTLGIHRYKYAVLTATRQVRDLLTSMNVEFDDVGSACQSRVRDKHIEWGTYYRNQPRVIVIDLAEALSAMSEPGWTPPMSRQPVGMKVHDAAQSISLR